MKTRLVGSMIFVLLIGANFAYVEAQRGRGGRGGGMGGNRGQVQRMRAQAMAIRAFPVERIWSGISFGISVPDSQLTIIRPIIKDAWAKRQGVLQIAKKDKSWKQAQEVLSALNKETDKKLEVLLTKAQRKQLKKLLKKTDFTRNIE